MPIFLLDETLRFPDPTLADPSGILAVGGDLSPRRLLLGYSLGIFPWFSDELPILWHCPDKRAVLRPAKLRIGQTNQKLIRRQLFQIRFDTAFERVIRLCAECPRPGEPGTWITESMIQAYTELHRLGHAHCAETWDSEQLVGGIYGVTLGRVFFGESMFSLKSNASKIALITLSQALHELGYELFDAQNQTDFLKTFGFEVISRKDFLHHLKRWLPHAPKKTWPENSFLQPNR